MRSSFLHSRWWRSKLRNIPRRVRKYWQRDRPKFLILISALAVIVGSLFLFSSRPPNLQTTTTSGSSHTGTYQSGVSSFSNSISASSSIVSQTYVTQSPLNSSQWIVINSQTAPLVVFSNLTGVIPRYQSLSSLNETRIGTFCDSIDRATGVCTAFKAYEESGWFWDSLNNVLYVHYVGAPAVKLIVTEKVYSSSV